MVPLALFGPLSGWEILVLLLLVILLFGARRIPEIARGLGQGIRDFRSSLRGEEEAEPGKTEEGDKASKGSEQ